MADEKNTSTENTDTATISEEDDFEFGGKKADEGKGDNNESGNEGNAGQKGGALPGKEDSKGNTEEQGTKEGDDQGAADGDKEDGKKAESDAEGTKDKTEDGTGSEEGKEDGAADSEKGKGTGKGEDGSDTGKGTKKESDDTGTIDDFFGEEYKESDSAGEKKTFDVKGFASEFDIETEDPVELKTKLNEKIENAKQDIKLDDYSADARGIIKHLNENEGELTDFFQNKEIASLQSIVGLPDEQKVLYVRTNEFVQLGMSKDEAIEKAETEVEEYGTREIKDIATKINTDANKLIVTEINKIVGDKDKIISQQRVKVNETKTKEVNTLKNHINAQANFMGIELTPKAKQNIVRDLESGAFDQIANSNPASSKLAAYMVAKFGKKIVENYSATASEQNRKGHNAALDTQTDALHKSKGSAQKNGTGKQEGQKGKGKNFDTWADDAMFEEKEAE